jgi:hypothetical protein
MSARWMFGLATAASVFALATASGAPAAAAPAKGHWSFVQGQPKKVKFTVSFNVRTVGFDIKLPSNVMATGVTAPHGFSCHVTFFLLISCHGTLAANQSKSGVVVLKKNARRGIGGHLHGYTGGVGVDGTMIGP